MDTAALALQLVPDLKYLALGFLAFLPGVTLLTVIYRRIRRRPPMIVAHWPMDLGAVIMTLTLRQSDALAYRVFEVAKNDDCSRYAA